MANVQAALRTLAAAAASPAELCDKVNNLLHKNVDVGKFVTFLYGVLDGETRTLYYCSAGHLFPILVSQGTYRILDGNGGVLGVFPSWHDENAKVQLHPGDRILFFSEGVTEAMDTHECEFGESGLATLAQAHASCFASGLNSLPLDEVSPFCGAHFDDDATLVVIAVK